MSVALSADAKNIATVTVNAHSVAEWGDPCHARYGAVPADANAVNGTLPAGFASVGRPLRQNKSERPGLQWRDPISER